MSDPFRTPEDYELFLYTLVERLPVISRSTLVFVRAGASMARVSGELFLQNGIRISIRERVVFDRLRLLIDGYGYEIWRGEDKLCWYDCQPHPEDLALAPTHPHHKHVPPDIKRHRKPAPGINFERPNLPLLMEEIRWLR